MTPTSLLAELSTLQELTCALVAGVRDQEVRRPYPPDFAPLGWYLGHCVYAESYWLRGEVMGDCRFSPTVTNLFTPGLTPLADCGLALPERDELLEWARGLQEQALTLLANPRQLPTHHPLLAENFLLHHLVVQYALAYENMLQVLAQGHLLSDTTNFIVNHPLVSQLPTVSRYREVSRGHYRIGAREGWAEDQELPPQIVELSAFRIAITPVSNGEYLAFMEAGGYQDSRWWDKAGSAWLAGKSAPHTWRQNQQGQWYGLGLSGPYELAENDPVTGVSRYEAGAYAAWAASLEGTEGAVLAHEYQWEVAHRLGYLETGRAWEWSSQPFHLYTGYQSRLTGAQLASPEDSESCYTLRGGSLHSRPYLRRASFRHWERPEARHRLTGLRLVLPPGQSFEVP